MVLFTIRETLVNVSCVKNAAQRMIIYDDDRVSASPSFHDLRRVN